MSTPCLHDESVFDMHDDARTDQHSEMTKSDSASEIPHSERRLIRSSGGLGMYLDYTQSDLAE